MGRPGRAKLNDGGNCGSAGIAMLGIGIGGRIRGNLRRGNAASGLFVTLLEGVSHFFGGRC